MRETVHSILQAGGQLFRYGIATGKGERNPASDLRGALRPVLVKNMAVITGPVALGAVLRAMQDQRRAALTRGALQRSALLFQPPGNVHAMRRAALDLDAEAPT